MSATERLPHPLQSEGPGGGQLPPEPPPTSAAKQKKWVFVVIGLLVVALIAVGFAAFQQHQQVTDRQEALTAATAQRDQARSDTAALASQVRRLKAALAKSTSASKGEAGQVSKLEAELANAKKQLTAAIGPVLANGKYFGALNAVGATQDPPKLVIDLEQFFKGAAADQAAKQDGALSPGETHVPNDVYIRNTSPQWRILAIDPSTKVSLSTSPFGTVEKPLVVPLARFGKIWANDSGNITQFPFWITVQNHIVVAIAEQYMP